MLRGIFEPFGRIDRIELMRDQDNRSKGFGFITFFDAEDAKKAQEQLNGFELAGRAMKVNTVTERSEYGSSSYGSLDSVENDRSGIELGSTGRLHLMAKLAEGTGIQLPQAAVTALQMSSGHRSSHHSTSSLTNINVISANAHTPVAVATQCFLLNNMFDVKAINNQDPDVAATETEEIRSDVLEECRKHGGALHIVVDTKSSGNVYVKCPNAITAAACVSALHGRYFSGELFDSLDCVCSLTIFFISLQVVE
jgi:RNA-binding protein 39